MRKHKHRNNGPFEDGVWRLVPPRRQHGLMKNVGIMPAAVAKARQRARLYMHSAERQWDVFLEFAREEIMAEGE